MYNKNVGKNNDILLTFVVLTYNHSGFVLEHLESLSYLIQKFSQDGKHDLVISDDASKDSTVLETSNWLKKNRNLFRCVTTYFGSSNVGTCKSFLRATQNIRTEYVKVTGGDDLYSDEDVFTEVCRFREAQIIGSQPLVLTDGILCRFHKFNLLHAMANAVYSGKPFRDQLVGHGVIFTPGLIYSAELISDHRVRNFVEKFSLVEDFPSWIAISEYYPKVKYRLSSANLVYYRRTPGSAYLIAGSRVFVDNLKCRQYLLATEQRIFNRLLIRNRIWQMTHCPPQVRKFCDIGRLIFAIKVIACFPSVLVNLRKLFVCLSSHVRHYDLIKERLALKNKALNYPIVKD